MHSPESLRFVGRALALNRISRIEPARVAALQRRRLEELVRFAVGRSPFYRSKYRGIDLGHFRLADLPPTLTTRQRYSPGGGSRHSTATSGWSKAPSRAIAAPGPVACAFLTASIQAVRQLRMRERS